MYRPLVCYDIDSDSSSEDFEFMQQDIKPEIQLVVNSPETVVSQLLEDIMDKVFHGRRDFSDMYIKEEPLDIDEIKEEFDTSYRDDIKVEMDSDADSSGDEVVSFFGQVYEDEELERAGTMKNPPKTKNELQLKDLPPVQDLDFTINESEVTKIGVIRSSVDELVVIESLPGNPAIDIDSVLFLDHGKRALGRVFDVIGPVALPYYCVRFNSKDHIQEKSVCPGMDVFYAPQSNEFTAYVFLDQLMKLKISDASWKDDEEPPPQFLQYSDDEEERKAKQEVQITKMVRAGASQDEVARKRARFDAPRQRRQQEIEEQRRDRSSSRDSGYNAPNYGYNTADGNLHYNAQRHNNGIYSQTMNPFYRQQRSFNLREMGPITWGSVRPGTSSTTTQNFNQAPPQYQMNSAGPPHFPNLSTAPPPPPPMFAQPPLRFSQPPPPPPPPQPANPQQGQGYQYHNYNQQPQQRHNGYNNW